MRQKLSRALLVVFLLGWLMVLACVALAGTTETSGITAATIITRAERYLDAADDPFYTDDDFIQWIDEAVKETVNRTGCLETTAITIPLVANTYDYALGQSFLRIISVEHDNGDTADHKQIISLDRVNKIDIGHNDTKGRPRLYCLWNNKLQVWPIPRTADAGTNLYVYTSPLPSGVSVTTSVIETPAYLDVALLYYVVAQAHFKNDRPGRAATFLGLYEKRLNEYIALVLQRKPVE